MYSIELEQRLEAVNNALKIAYHMGPAEYQMDLLWKREHLQDRIYRTQGNQKVSFRYNVLANQIETAINRLDEARCNQMPGDDFEVDLWERTLESLQQDLYVEFNAVNGRFLCEICLVPIRTGLDPHSNRCFRHW